MINKDKVRRYEIREENAKLKKQLKIAVEALKQYADCSNWFEVCDGNCTFESIYGTEEDLAQESLNQIKELDK